MKSIGISEKVYQQLLWVKHEMEKKEKKVISYDKVILKLIKERI